MIDLRGILAVFRFEWRRSLTIPRVSWWVVLALFPPLMVGLIRFNADMDLSADFWVPLLYGLVPSVVCMLGVFLWTTSAIASELEAGSWIYLAVRPNGRSSVLVGKYLFAISWTMATALTGLTVAVVVASPEQAMRVWSVVAALVLLSCPAFGAVYSLIGVVFIKRAMVAAVVYTLVVEILLGFVPAMVNELTVQLRLRSLMWRWMEWDSHTQGRMAESKMFFSDAPVWQHLLILFGLTAGLMFLAVLLLRQKELCAAGDETP